jgi:energy-coupling factor transporter ATP-binding protein EcfA2
MLKSLEIKNLTVFATGNLQFSPHLNVFVGENGTGKSHLLKVLYAVLATIAEEGRRSNIGSPTKRNVKQKLADKLISVLRPESLGSLVRRQVRGNPCEIRCHSVDTEHDVDFHFTTKSRSEVVLDNVPISWLKDSPVFLPTRELLTIYPGFVSFYDSHYLEFEETWRNTCALLALPILRGQKEDKVRKLLAPLEEAMGGAVEYDKNGRFYLNTEQEGRIEMPLVAEGLRKLAMLARLIATGSLLNKGTLFWDEPESNLNPKLIKDVARIVLHLCQNGIQVFIATHSLFLMREFDILLRNQEWIGLSARFFGLQRKIDGDGVEIEQGDSIDDIGAIAALDEELSQSDRYLQAEV